MSKTSKAKTKQENLRKKRAIKAANRAKYESWRRDGSNTKSKRVRAKSKNKGVSVLRKRRHEATNCGNPACGNCFPQHQKVNL